jgi:MoaA/NifB/PqqE/SkfB family radical SAM enzyme
MRDRMMLTFVMSHACPLKCDFCCSNREVVGDGRISRSMIERCLTGFGRELPLERFGFSGGDPFLYLADITTAMESARRSGIAQPFQIVTSCYWAKSPDQILSVLEPLKALGLDLLGISYDREHARWVSAQQIRDVCHVAERLDIRINVTGVFWDETDSVQAMLPEFAAQPTRIHIVNLPVAPIGDAREQRKPLRFSIPVEEKLSCGRPGYYSLSVYPDGEVYPCCSGGFQIEGRLSCGNVLKDPPARILFAATTNFHVRLVKEFGWGLLYTLVEREAPALLAQLPSLERASGVCEICRDLNVNLREKLAPIYEPIEIEYARTRAEFEWRSSFGDDTTPRAFGVTAATLDDILDMLTRDRGCRLDYLAGLIQLPNHAAVSAPIAPDHGAGWAETLTRAL